MYSILLIGNIDFQNLAKEILDNCGYKTELTTSSENALLSFDRVRHDLDMILVSRDTNPGSVDTVVSHIRKQDEFLPIVLFSFSDKNFTELRQKEIGYSSWISEGLEKGCIVEQIDMIVAASKIFSYAHNE